MEALVRWDHPRLGRIPQEAFVGVAETTGLIVPLGRWVLYRVCREAVRWVGLTPRPPYVSVNLAVRQILEPGLVDDVAGALRASGLAPHQLQLEITEDAVMRTAGAQLSVLERLRDMGVRIAIDDFGAGYSNLACLRTLPVHVLKLDSGFTRGLGAATQSDLVNEQIVAALVAMARALDLTVVAAGVETEAQADFLRAIGVDAGQGYYLGMPEPPALAARMLRGGLRRVAARPGVG
jgi:EAL domain-containing protein (putative c-di-GMP-specific phosphodiesterase class I)